MSFENPHLSLPVKCLKIICIKQQKCRQQSTAPSARNRMTILLRHGAGEICSHFLHVHFCTLCLCKHQQRICAIDIFGVYINSIHPLRLRNCIWRVEIQFAASAKIGTVLINRVCDRPTTHRAARKERTKRKRCVFFFGCVRFTFA